MSVVVWSFILTRAEHHMRQCNSCSPDDGHNDARNMLREKFDNKYQISCILLISLSSPYVHEARSQEPKVLVNFSNFASNFRTLNNNNNTLFVFVAAAQIGPRAPRP